MGPAPDQRLFPDPVAAQPYRDDDGGLLIGESGDRIDVLCVSAIGRPIVFRVEDTGVARALAARLMAFANGLHS